MSKIHGFLRRLRGALGMGLIWGAAWFAGGMAIMLTSLLLTGSTGADVPYPVGFGALGFIAGVGFSGVVSLVGGRRRFDELSIPRFAGWGGIGGLLFSVLFVTVVTVFDDPTFFENLVFLGPIFTAIGAGTAGGALAVARKAEDGELLESGEDLPQLPDA